MAKIHHERAESRTHAPSGICAVRSGGAHGKLCSTGGFAISSNHRFRTTSSRNCAARLAPGGVTTLVLDCRPAYASPNKAPSLAAMNRY